MDEDKIKRAIITLLAVSAFASAQATSFVLDLGPPRGVTEDLPAFRLSLDQFNGVALNGQTLSLDFTFARGEWVRLFSNTFPLFGANIIFGVTANAAGAPLGQSDAYAFGADHQPIPFGLTSIVSSAQFQDLGAAVFPILKDSSGARDPLAPSPLDVYGFHFDFTLPNVNEGTLTGGFFVVSDGPGSNFTIEPIPDKGSTLPLLMLGLVPIFAVRKIRGTCATRNSRAS